MSSESKGRRVAKPVDVALVTLGWAAIAAGLFGIAFGSLWAGAALDFFASRPIVSRFDLIVPFLPILSIAIGAGCVIRSRT